MVWNPSDKSANITLTSGNTIATTTSSTIGGVRSTEFQSTGKYYWEVTGPSIRVSLNTGPGFGDAAVPFSAFAGSTASGYGWFPTGAIYNNNTTSVTIASYSAGDTLGFAVDLDNRLFWGRVNGGNWNNSGANDPTTGVGGKPLAGFADLYAIEVFNDNASTSTLSFSASAPTGFTAGIPAGGVHYAAAYTFDPVTRYSSNVRLSNGLLTANGVNTSYGVAMSATATGSGKYYWEITATAVTTSFAGIGIANASATLTTWLGNTGNNTLGYEIAGGVFRNGGSVSTIASYTNGDTICVALDTVNHRIWFRKNAGNWNNNGANDPSTNVGGIDISLITGALYPAINTEAATHVLTANFGATTFAQTVPSGFTAFAAPVSASPGVGSIVFTGFAPTVTTNAAAAPGVGSIVLTGFAPTVTTNSVVSPGVGSIVLTGFAPTATVNAAAAPGVGSIVLTGFAPTTTVNAVVSPAAGSIVLTGFVPTDNATVTPGAGSIVFSGFAPTATVTTDLFFRGFP